MEKPKVRSAKFSDIPEIVRLCKEALKRSKYAAFADLSETELKTQLMTCINMQGEAKAGSTIVIVADNGVCLEGCLIAVIRPLYEVLTANVATDLFTYAQQGAHGQTGFRLIRAMHRWARKSETKTLIRHATSDAIEDQESVGRLFRRQGMKQVAAIFEKEN
jgi:hypothetical protein